MTAKSERLTVLSDAEQEALYGLPDFDDTQRLEYPALTATELALASRRPSLAAQVYCVLQIGYFKAKHAFFLQIGYFKAKYAFFRFEWNEVEYERALIQGDPQLERNVHRSQNRIESYHQLRSTIAQVGGKKQLTGRTDIEIEISNQCARLIANAVIFYNSAILSRLLAKYEVSRNAKALVLIAQMSPAAWRHTLLNGHYTLQSDGKMIDLDTLVAGLELG